MWFLFHFNLTTDFINLKLIINWFMYCMLTDLWVCKTNLNKRFNIFGYKGKKICFSVTSHIISNIFGVFSHVKYYLIKFGYPISSNSICLSIFIDQIRWYSSSYI